MRKKKDRKPRPAPEDPNRLPALVLSPIAAIGFGAGGLYALWNHAISWPGRSGNPLALRGPDADLFGWVLLLCSAAMLSQFALALKPGRAGVPWIVGIFSVWAIALAGYYLLPWR